MENDVDSETLDALFNLEELVAETGIIRSFKMHHDGVWTVSQDNKEQKHDLGQISEINTFEEVSESCSVMSNSLQPH